MNRIDRLNAAAIVAQAILDTQEAGAPTVLSPELGCMIEARIAMALAHLKAHLTPNAAPVSRGGEYDVH